MHQVPVSNFNNIFSKIGFNDPISSQGATFKLTFYGHMDEEVTPQTFLTEGNGNTFTLSNSLFDITVTFDVTSGGITVTNVSKSEGPSWSDSEEVINQTLFSSDTTSFVDVEGLGKIELSYTNSEGVTKIASVDVQQGSWNDGTGSVLAETENFLPYSDRYSTVEVEDVVARVRKNTGKFEGIKGIETGPEDRFEELLTPVLLSSDNLTLTVGQYSCTLLDSNFESSPWVGEGVEFSTIYFGDSSKIDPVVGAPSGSDEALFSVDLLNLTVSKGLLWDNSSVNSFDMIYSISGSLGNGEIGISFPNGSAVFTPESSLVFTTINSIDLPYSKRISKNSYSVSRQGECTFSEIVETGASTSVSINKNTGVLTCSEFIEGDYSTTIKYLDGFSGSVSGNKITCNNGYTFELFSDSNCTVPVNYSEAVGTSSDTFSLVGTTNAIVGDLDISKNTLVFDETYNPTVYDDWSSDSQLYIVYISLSVGSIYYMKITDPNGNSRKYVNSEYGHGDFYPVSSNDNLYIPSKYRYQNYLI